MACYRKLLNSLHGKVPAPRVTGHAKERLLDKVVAGWGGCWLFTGCNTRGYGSLAGNDGKTQRAHRLAYELLVGPIPAGLHVDHLCHKRDGSCPGGVTCLHRRCVNPAHLKPTTQRENSLRGMSFSAANIRKTHCAQGHEFSPANTYLRPNGDKPPTRQCRRCIADWQTAYQRRKKQAHPA